MSNRPRTGAHVRDVVLGDRHREHGPALLEAGTVAAGGVESLLRLPPLGVVDARGVDRVGGEREIQGPGGVASARELVAHEGDCLVPIVWVDLGVPGDDRHEEFLAFKTPRGR